ncbi:hypothetical protein M2271_000026 [Streptomyces sp. LBL]|uniref:hypothetical protein n=1 Tax=Streptomyces sp. LBL TaxID=2940562 RepID=UPI002473BB4D|nr:hypothetical protein [Streptomyces sp. LBL]MDH6622239.1 hypothetical protein [Streptomyces sp. LBL]
MATTQLVTLRIAVIADAPVERDGLTGQVTDALKIDPVEVRGIIEELIARSR